MIQVSKSGASEISIIQPSNIWQLLENMPKIYVEKQNQIKCECQTDKQILGLELDLTSNWAGANQLTVLTRIS